MAIGVSAGGRGRRERGAPALAEINVTPFVDVALVLLIIFMITAHVMEYGIEINVPKTKTTKSTSKDLPVISLNKSGELFLGKEAVNVNLLGSAVRSRYPDQTSVFVRADRETTYDVVASVLAALGEAKLNPVLVTQPTGGARP